MSDFREDGRDALEWAARYLERVDELPVLSRVEPGHVRSRLPPSPPDQAEPFSAVLRDVEEILLPAMTHWQSSRYFGYFAIFAANNSAPNSRIVTVEPSSRNLAVLRANIAAAGLSQITPVHGAIADESGTLDLPAGLKTVLQIHVADAGDYYTVRSDIPQRAGGSGGA